MRISSHFNLLNVSDLAQKLYLSFLYTDVKELEVASHLRKRKFKTPLGKLFVRSELDDGFYFHSKTTTHT